MRQELAFLGPGEGLEHWEGGCAVTTYPPDQKYFSS